MASNYLDLLNELWDQKLVLFTMGQTKRVYALIKESLAKNIACEFG